MTKLRWVFRIIFPTLLTTSGNTCGSEAPNAAAYFKELGDKTTVNTLYNWQNNLSNID